MQSICIAVIIFTFSQFCSDTVNGQLLTGIPPGHVKHVAFGKTIGVTCSPDSTATPIDLKWYGPNIYFPTANEKTLIKSKVDMPREDDGAYSRIYTEPNGNNLKLFINQVRPEDTGLYNCTGKVNNIPSSWSFELQAFVGLTVAAAPEQILVHEENSKIECLVRSQPPPETSWHFNAIYINPQASSKYELTPDGLTVYDVNFADAGIYECVGTELTQGTALRKEIRVDVVTRPKMVVPPVNTTGIRSRDARILCNATSIPPPEYKWYLGTSTHIGKEVTSLSMGDRFRPSSTDGDLFIVDVHLEDQQWFWCEGNSRAGKVSGKAFFEVHMIPVFSDGFNVNNTETRIGNTAVMICQSEGQPDPKMKFHRVGFPSPYINGEQQDDPRIKVYEKSSTPSEENQKIVAQEVVIEIKNATPNDTANYTCIAENAAGRNETTMHIIIQHPPNYDLTPDSLLTQCIWEEHPRNVTVLLSGYPQPSVSWSRGDGKQISPDQTAFKFFFEPYWANGRRDEWMANLEINWEVTKGGIQGAFKPVGNYFPRASNNLDSADFTDFTINVVEAQLPGRINGFNVTDRTAQSITISANPPVEENCIQPLGFEILYKLHSTNDVQQTALFPTAMRKSMRIDGLKAGASYMFLVYSRNERGRGEYPNSRIIETSESTVPAVVTVTSDQKARSNVSHQVVWATPIDGGEPITQYVISWREVGESIWEKREIPGSSIWWTITNLQPDTQYELKVQARNSKGLSSDPDPLNTFSTPPGKTYPTADTLSEYNLPVELHFLVVISVVGLLTIIVAVDMVCYCSRNWGILACICSGEGQPPKHTQGDIIFLDGADSMTSAASRDTATHGQDNRTYNKYESRHELGGDALTTFSSPPTEARLPAHEYINTGRLNKAPAAASRSMPREHSNARPYNTSHPVPQPRVPSQVTIPHYHNGDRYGQPPPRPAGDQSRADAYTPTLAASNASNARPYTSSSRYHSYQPPRNNGNDHVDHYEHTRPSPAPSSRPTMI